MHTDVKLGVVVAMVVVLVSGGYYMYRNKQQQPIPLGEGVTVAKAQPAVDEPGPGAKQPPQAQRTSPSVAQQKPSKRPAAAKNRNARRSGQTAPGGARPSRPNPKVGQPAPNQTGRDGLTPPQRLARRRGAGKATRQPGSNSPTTTPSRERGGRQQVATGQKPVDRATANRTKAGDGAAKRPATQLPPVSVKIADTTPQQSKSVPLTATREESVAVEKHRVQPGDTLAAIAIQYYGGERYTQLLIDANKQLANPNRLKIGDVIIIPPAPKRTTRPERTTRRSTTGSSTPAQPSGLRTYTVRPGDSFYAIARDQLGDSGRWKELFALNRELVGGEPTALRVGQVLVLPK